MTSRAARLLMTAAVPVAVAAAVAGTASAAPRDTVINTPCSFGQVVAATYAVSPEDGDALANSVFSGQFTAFLAAPPDQRRLVLDLQPWIDDRINAVFGGPGSAIANTVFATCGDF